MFRGIKDVFPENIRNVFFENVSLRQIIFKNTFWLLSAEVITHFLRLVLIIYAARILGAIEYGKFTFAYSFVSLFTILSDLGLSSLITWEFSNNREKEKEYPAIISLKIFLSVAVMILTFGGSFFITNVGLIRKTVLILAFFVFVDGFFGIVYPFIRARQKMEYEAAIRIFQTLCLVLIGLPVVFIFSSALMLSYAYFFSSIITLTIAAAFFHFLLYFLKLNFNLKIWVKFLRNSWPLAFGFIGTWMFINLDSAMIGFLGKPFEVGWFNAASKIILSILLILAGLISRSFYPLFSKLFSESKTKLQNSWDYYLKITTMIALPITFGGIILAPKIIDFLYGYDKYDSSVFIFQLLMVLAGISFFYYPYSIMAIVSGQQKTNFFIILFGVAINIILNFVFIPKFGFTFAGINTIISAIISFILIASFSWRRATINLFNLKMLKVFIFSLFSSVAMFFIIKLFLAYNLNIFLLFFIGCAAYFIFYFTVKNLAEFLVKK